MAPPAVTNKPPAITLTLPSPRMANTSVVVPTLALTRLNAVADARVLLTCKTSLAYAEPVSEACTVSTGVPVAVDEMEPPPSTTAKPPAVTVAPPAVTINPPETIVSPPAFTIKPPSYL